MQILRTSSKKILIKPNFLISLNSNESSFVASKMKPKSLFHRNSYRVSNIKNEKGNENIIEKNNSSEYSNFQAFIEKMIDKISLLKYLIYLFFLTRKMSLFVFKRILQVK